MGRQGLSEIPDRASAGGPDMPALWDADYKGTKRRRKAVGAAGLR